MWQILSSIQQDLTACWKQLVTTDLFYKVIAYILLTPLLGLILRIILSTSGSEFLADQDILYFLLKPTGWVYGLIAAGAWLAIVALELAALIYVLAANRQKKKLPLQKVLYLTSTHAMSVMTVTVQMVVHTLITMVPFLLAIGIIYFLLLNEYDINFYLQERPPEFLLAVSLVGLLATILVGILLWRFTGWFLALPVLLFEEVSSRRTLKTSYERMQGYRRLAIIELVSWFLFTTILSTLVSSMVVGIGRVIVPMTAKSLTLLIPIIGVLVLSWLTLGLIANLLSTILFASILSATYEHVGGELNADFASHLPSKYDALREKLTARRAAAFGLVAVVLSTILGVLLVRTLRNDNHVEVIAHRGASVSAPENTLASIQMAIDAGADWIEIDVQETADGKVAVFHDSDFMKLAGNPLKIWDATETDIKSIDIGSSFSPQYQDERVPLLEEVLELCKSKAKVLIELKYYGHQDQLEQRVVDLVKQNDMESEVMYMSLKLPAVEKIKEIEPQSKVGILLSMVAGDLKSFPAELWAVNSRLASRQTIKKAHISGRQVFVWTVNDALSMSRLIGRGVDGLITDDPSLARSVIEQLNQRSPIDLMLLELVDLFGLEQKASNQ